MTNQPIPNFSAEDSICSILSRLPNENNDEYVRILLRSVIDNNLSDRENEIEKYLQNINSKYRFSAFYSLLIICREHNNYSKYNYYVDKYASEFSMYKLYKIVMSTYYRNKGLLGDKNSYKRSIRFAEDACTAMPTNITVKYHYSAMIVYAIEDGFDVGSDAINKAIALLDEVTIFYPNIALYYCTQGQLLAATGDYQRGMACIKKALDLEDGRDKESMIRIGDYNFHLMQIKLMIESERINKEVCDFNAAFHDVKEDLADVKTQYLEYLAFFSSILAFILSTVNLVISADKFNKSAGIILMFMGALIVAFGAFRMLLPISKKDRCGIIMLIVYMVIGIAFLVAGYLIGNCPTV